MSEKQWQNRLKTWFLIKQIKNSSKIWRKIKIIKCWPSDCTWSWFKGIWSWVPKKKKILYFRYAEKLIIIYFWIKKCSNSAEINVFIQNFDTNVLLICNCENSFSWFHSRIKYQEVFYLATNLIWSSTQLLYDESVKKVRPNLYNFR